nr:autotransporter-associated beta strand repeat-containing protein [Burkholderia cepacia]
MKTDSGTLLLAANNTSTGGTTSSAGTLQLGNGGTRGNIVRDVTNNGALAVDCSDISASGGTISGSGAVNQIGTGTTVLTVNNTYAGCTTIAAGTLQLGNGGTSGSITGNVVNDGTLTLDRSDTAIFGGQISGTCTVTQIGTGTTVLTGNNSYADGTTGFAGTLQQGNGGTSGLITGNGDACVARRYRLRYLYRAFHQDALPSGIFNESMLFFRCSLSSAGNSQPDSSVSLTVSSLRDRADAPFLQGFSRSIDNRVGVI